MAGDVDLIITVQNQQAIAALAQTNAALGATTAAAGTGAGDAASGLAGGMNRIATSFDRTALRSGVMVAQLGHVRQIMAAITLLSDPITAGALAVGGLAYYIYKTETAANALKKAELDKHLKLVEEETKAAAAGFEALADAMGKGRVAQDALLESAVAFSDHFNNVRKAQIAEELATGSAQAVALENEIRLWNDKKNAREADHKSTALYEQHINGLQDQLDKLKDKLSESGRELRSVGDDMAANNKILEGEKDRLKDATDARHDYNTELSDTAEGMSALFSIYERISRASFGKKKPAAFAGDPMTNNSYANVVGGLSEDEPITSLDLLAAKIQDTADVTESESYRIAESFQMIGESIALNLAQVGIPIFDAYTTAVYDLTHAHEVSANGIVKALAKQVTASIVQIGEEAAVRALYEQALALASLAIGDGAGFTAHQIAAAEYGIVATAAGAIAGASGAHPGGGGSGGGGSYGGGGYSNGGDNTTINVTVIGTLDDEAAKDLHDQIANAKKNGDWN